MAQSILIVDDEKEIVSMLYCYFSKLGYTVYTATAGNAALKEVEKKPDIILLDVNMPDIDGFTVCERIRDYVSCPIIFLTARIEDSDKIKGFSIGADDYVIKPFSVDELEARIAAHLRREKRHNTSSKVQFDEDMVIDYSSRIVFYHNKDMAFTKKEFDIISFLSQNKTSVYKGYKQDKIEMRGDRAEMSDFPLYLNTVAGGLDRRDQTIGGFSFVVKIYAVPVIEIIG